MEIFGAVFSGVHNRACVARSLGVDLSLHPGLVSSGIINLLENTRRSLNLSKLTRPASCGILMGWRGMVRRVLAALDSHCCLQELAFS